MQLAIPQPLKAEHAELHAELVEATKAGGRVGDAAKAVAKVLHPHFVREEEFALPPLGILAALVKGEVTSEMAGVIAMTDNLEAELPHMLSEHREIVAALETLVAAAKAEHQARYARFAEKLILHAKTEEEVLYPTSLLIGRYLKLMLQERGKS